MINYCNISIHSSALWLSHAVLSRTLCCLINNIIVFMCPFVCLSVFMSVLSWTLSNLKYLIWFQYSETPVLGLVRFAPDVSKPTTKLKPGPKALAFGTKADVAKTTRFSFMVKTQDYHASSKRRTDIAVRYSVNYSSVCYWRYSAELPTRRVRPFHFSCVCLSVRS